ncbi:MAG: ribonuclease HI [Labilibaculum sp.]|nr:ribonuclease HI [Labilibaculum sp.]MBI9056997.1 ribonuclease HI [Labilibaculum sp.]
MEKWKDTTPKINLYSDGGSDPNPGKGGFGVILSWGNFKKEFSEGYILTTNNRMELSGVIFGLEKLKKDSDVTVFTDSRYVIDGIEKGWAKRWQENNWYRNKKEKAINPDLWEKLLKLTDIHKVKFQWIKGHNGHPENERCDSLATLAMNKNNLIEDSGYIETPLNPKTLQEGDLCRKCNTPLIIKRPTKRKFKKGQVYYFEYYLYCEKCKSIYMIEEAKRLMQENPEANLFE